jgi:hypothetical protein
VVRKKEARKERKKERTSRSIMNEDSLNDQKIVLYIFEIFLSPDSIANGLHGTAIVFVFLVRTNFFARSQSCEK